jgi:hypothetical protein
MSYETETIKASAYWASYLINNDASGLDDAELALADAWLVQHGLERAEFVDVAEPFFSWYYGFHTGADCQGGDLAEYTVIRDPAAGRAAVYA